MADIVAVDESMIPYEDLEKRLSVWERRKKEIVPKDDYRALIESDTPNIGYILARQHCIMGKPERHTVGWYLFGSGVTSATLTMAGIGIGSLFGAPVEGGCIATAAGGLIGSFAAYLDRNREISKDRRKRRNNANLVAAAKEMFEQSYMPGDIVLVDVPRWTFPILSTVASDGSVITGAYQEEERDRREDIVCAMDIAEEVDYSYLEGTPVLVDQRANPFPAFAWNRRANKEHIILCRQYGISEEELTVPRAMLGQETKLFYLEPRRRSRLYR